MLTLTIYAVLQQIYLEEGGHMKKRYDPELIKDELKKLIQQTLREALEAELEDFLSVC